MRAVIDTNVLFEGLTKGTGSCNIIVQAWHYGFFDAHTSTPLILEYIDVCGRLLSARRWEILRPQLGTLIAQSSATRIHYTWRPSSPDPGDELVIDCAMNANAWVVSYNVKDFRSARQSLGLRVATPRQFVEMLNRQK